MDAASYSNVRRFLARAPCLRADAVRLEEMVNYFPYRYPDRAGEHPFGLIADVGPCPWAGDHRLVRVGAAGPTGGHAGAAAEQSGLPDRRLRLDAVARQAAAGPARLPCAGAGAPPETGSPSWSTPARRGSSFPPLPGPERGILDAIDRLEAGGSTAGGAGLRLAYDVAREHFLPEGNNRVILATDGDFNVGVSSDAEMIRLVERRREEGTFLTVLGSAPGT